MAELLPPASSSAAAEEPSPEQRPQSAGIEAPEEELRRILAVGQYFRSSRKNATAHRDAYRIGCKKLCRPWRITIAFGDCVCKEGFKAALNGHWLDQCPSDYLLK
jgi:hypothetical protein